MSLFSGSTEYFAFAASMGVIPELTSTLKGEILKSILSNNPGGITYAIKFTIGTDMYARARSMLRYAEKDDGYIRKFPTSNMNIARIDPDETAAALTRAVGPYDSIVSVFSGGIKERFWLAQALKAVYLNTEYFSWTVAPSANWDEGRDTVQIPVINPDTGVYYEVDNVPNYDRKILYGQTPGDFDPDDYIFEDYSGLFNGTYTVTFDYIDNLGAPAVYTMDGLLDMLITDYNAQYVQVRYMVGDETRYWAYVIGSNLDPIYENTIITTDRYAQYLPVMVLMQDEVWFDEAPDSELAKTTNKMLGKLGTTGTEIREEFQAQEEEDKKKNKGQPKKWDFFIHFAVPIHTQVRGSKQYLYHFFRKLEEWQGGSAEDYYAYLATANVSGEGYTAAQPVNELVIKEAGLNGYNVNYRWSFIETREYPGRAEIDHVVLVAVDPDDPETRIVARKVPRPMKYREAKIQLLERTEDTTWVDGYWEGGQWLVEPEIFGSSGSGEFGTPNPNREWVPGYFRQQDPLYQEIVDEFYGPDTPIGQWYEGPKEDGSNAEKNRKKQEIVGYHDIILITRQNKYDPDNPEVTGYTKTLIMGLSMQYVINTSNASYDYRFRYAIPRLFGLNSETREFRIPIHAESLKQVSRMHREEVLQDGLTATVFLVAKQHVAWYQTGFFKWLIIIIAIILIILSIVYAAGAGSEEGVSLIGAMVGATGATAGSFTAFILTVAFSFAIGYIIALAGSLIGGTWGKVFMIVAAVVMLYAASVNGGGLKNAWTNLQSNPGWATAGNFIGAVGAYYEIGFSVYQSYKLDQLQDKMDDFLMMNRERQEKLEEQYATLGPGPEGVDALDLARIFQNQGSWETPEQYLARTKMTNPGQMALEYVYNFPQAALMLPKAFGQPSIVDGLFLDLAGQRGA